ncbi:MAG: hypothetical protein ACKVWR_07855 [Acidimicrobiales bacterium]
MEHTLSNLLDTDAVLLPEREALGVWDFASVVGNNSSLGLNAGTFGPATATATASQVITVSQA